jgi:hypothetical protein
MEGELWKWTNYWNGKFAEIQITKIIFKSDSDKFF